MLNYNQLVIIKKSQPNLKWPPQKLIKPSPNIIVTWKVTIHVQLYLGYAQIYWVFNGTLNLLFLARFCKTLFLPEFFSNQLEHNTPRLVRRGAMTFLSHPTYSSGFIHDFLHHYTFEWQKGNFCLLVKWADTALCCSSNAKDSICLLVKWADTAFWLERQ